MENFFGANQDLTTGFEHLSAAYPKKNDPAISAALRDIGERSRIEEHLRRNHETFFNLVRNAPFGIYIVDHEFRLRTVSASAEKVFSEIKPLLGRDFAEIMRQFWEAPFAQEAIEHFRHTLATGEPYQSKDTTEQRGNVKDIESYDWKIERINLPDGNFGVVCYFYDLTERNAAEAALRESEEKYRLFFEKNPLPVAISEAKTLRILEINEAAISLYGYSRKEFLSMTFWDIIAPDDFTKVAEFAQKSENSDVLLSFPVRHRKKNGETIDVEYSRYKIEFDNRPARLAIIQDVTERRQAERLLREKNQLLEQTYDAIFIWNLKDGITSWNPNAERLYGYTASEAVGRRSQDLLKTVFPLSVENFISELREKGFWEGELTHTAKSGAEIVIQGRLYVLERDEQNLVVLETLRDITERQRLEANLARAAQLALVGELAAGLAHEIKNPLAGIKGVIDIMLHRNRANGGSDDDREILASVSHEIERIDKTVRALLQYSRPKPLEIHLSSLNETVRHAAQIAAHRANRHNTHPEKIPIELELPKKNFLVSHDAAKIEDAVLNLLINAADAIGKQENGKISVRLKKAKSRYGEQARIEIKDNGCGIAAEKLEKLFTPFQTSKDDGNGLGLTSVKRIARAHGGDCIVRSKLGKGSVFTITLPFENGKIY